MDAWKKQRANLSFTSVPQDELAPQSSQSSLWNSALDSVNKKTKLVAQKVGLSKQHEVPATLSGKCWHKMTNSFVLSKTQSFAAFVLFALAGGMMLSMSFLSVNLILIGKPTKFAITYGLGNVFLLSSSCFLVGPTSQMQTMFQGQRLFSSCLYMGSLLATFYCSWRHPSVFIVVPVVFVQFLSLLWYLASYVPFAQNIMGGLFGRVAKASARAALPV